MADDHHTLELIGRHLIKAVEPLIEAGGSLGAFMRLMGRIGFFASDIPPPYQALANSVSDARDALNALSDDPSLTDILTLLEKAKGVYDAIQQLGSGPMPSGADAASYAQEIGERLFELLLTDYLADEQPDAFTVTPTGLNTATIQVSGPHPVINTSNTATLTIDPVGSADTVTVLGTSGIDTITVTYGATTTVACRTGAPATCGAASRARRAMRRPRQSSP